MCRRSGGTERRKATRMRRHRGWSAVGAVAVGIGFGIAATAIAQTSPTDEAVARVGDQVITASQLEDTWQQNDASSRMRLLQQVYETRRRALDVVIGDRLIEREAAARGITRAELLDIELPARTLPVTEEEIEMIYDRNRNAFGERTLDQMREEIRAAIGQQRPAQALFQFGRDLRAAANDVSVSLEPPRQRIEVLADDPSRGPENAPLVLVEFSDFQCPYCQRATDTLRELLAEYEGQIRFVYKDYPLPNHAQAFKAAEAGNCAQEQGKFWELHDEMFGHQDALDVPSLKTYAAELGLDEAAFSACLDGGRYAAGVQRDLAIGQQYGVSSTPTVFVNGRMVMGALPYDAFNEIIQEELAR